MIYYANAIMRWTWICIVLDISACRVCGENCLLKLVAQQRLRFENKIGKKLEN